MATALPHLDHRRSILLSFAHRLQPQKISPKWMKFPSIPSLKREQRSASPDIDPRSLQDHFGITALFEGTAPYPGMIAALPTPERTRQTRINLE